MLVRLIVFGTIFKSFKLNLTFVTLGIYLQNID